ncbi:MAG: MFS transporter [Anaerolineaceae bacterium]|nr:MFS transporter [Anaerolineaceae bacterium]
MKVNALTQNHPHWLANRLSFFYGWMMVPIALLTNLATMPGQTIFISIFNPYFQETLNLSLSQISGAYMVCTLLAAVPQPYLGKWIDRLGFRSMMIYVVILLGLTCMLTSRIQNIWMLVLSFFFLRLFGQGILSLLAGNTLAMWFRKRLGTISATAGVLLSFSMGLIPMANLALINQFGWRNTYFIAGLIVWGVMLPVTIFIYINRPEDVGQQVDGLQIGSEESPEEKHLQRPAPLDLRAAIRTRSFWIMIAIFSCWSLVGTAYVYNMIPILTARGLSETQAAASYVGLSTIAAMLRFFGGYLADHIPLNWLVFASAGTYAVALSVLTFAPISWMMIVFAVLYGVAQALVNGVMATVWVRYFGRDHLGKISSIVIAAMVAGSSAGPFLLGIAFDTLGSFQVALVGFIILMAVLAIAGIFATPPQRKMIHMDR